MCRKMIRDWCRTPVRKERHGGRESVGVSGLVFSTFLKAAVVLLLAAVTAHAQTTGPAAGGQPHYQQREPSGPDGTGRFYMGREIARFMSYRGAPWLDRPERRGEERTDLLVDALDVGPGDVVADIGAGTGYFSLPLARRVGPRGRVLAVDIQREMLDKLRVRLKDNNVSNVDLILGEATDPGLPEGTLDLVLMVDVYHEFSYPWEMARHIRQALKPDGRVVLVEYRAEDPNVPIKRLHKMSEAQVIREMTAHGLDWKETITTLPRQHIIVLQR